MNEKLHIDGIDEDKEKGMEENSSAFLGENLVKTEKTSTRDTAPKMSAIDIKTRAIQITVEEILKSVSFHEFLSIVIDTIREKNPNYVKELTEVIYAKGDMIDLLTVVWEKMPDNIKALELTSVIKDLKTSENYLDHLLTIVFECFGCYDKELEELGTNSIFYITTIANLIELFKRHPNFPNLERYLKEKCGL